MVSPSDKHNTEIHISSVQRHDNIPGFHFQDEFHAIFVMHKRRKSGFKVRSDFESLATCVLGLEDGSMGRRPVRGVGGWRPVRATMGRSAILELTLRYTAIHCDTLRFFVYFDKPFILADSQYSIVYY